MVLKQSYKTLIILIIICACSKSDVQRLSLENQINDRFNRTINQKLDECRLRAIQEAEIQVDSIIDRLLKKDLIDSLEFPNKPIRPDRPENIIKKDDDQDS